MSYCRDFYASKNVFGSLAVLSFLIDLILSKKNQGIILLLCFLLFTRTVQTHPKKVESCFEKDKQILAQTEKQIMKMRKESLDKRHNLLICTLEKWPLGSSIKKVELFDRRLTIEATAFEQTRHIVEKGFCASDKIFQKIDKEKNLATVQLWFDF